MPCNLNFNQCNTGCNFPRPIFTCFRNFIALLNQSGNTIVNPVVEGATLLSAVNPQTVLAGGLVVPVTSFSSGSAITNDNGGTFTAVFGRYLVSYNLNGNIGANGSSSYALYLDGVIIPSSQSTTSGTAGASTTHSGSAFVQIVNPTGAITLRNVNTSTAVLNGGSVNIQKIN